MSYRYEVQRSPNYSSRAAYGYDSEPYGITIHHWGRLGQQHQNVVDYLCREGGNSSAHEVISDGRVTHLVDFNLAAWHAGTNRGNGAWIGLECRPEMSPGDMETVAQRCADIENQLGKSLHYNGHKDFKATACPGDWYDQIGRLVNRINEIHAGVNPNPEQGAQHEQEDDDMQPWELLNTETPVWGGGHGDDTMKHWQQVQQSRTYGMWGWQVSREVRELVTKQNAQLAGLSEAVKALASQQGIDGDQLIERIDQTVRAAMADTVDVDVTVDDQTGEQA